MPLLKQQMQLIRDGETIPFFTGFGAGYFTAGGPFVWTLLLAGAVFVVWAAIAADLTAKIPLAG